MNDKLWTVEEISEYLGVHVVTVRRWIRSGKLTAVALGRKAGYRIRDVDLQSFLSESSTGDSDSKMAA